MGFIEIFMWFIGNFWGIFIEFLGIFLWIFVNILSSKNYLYCCFCLLYWVFTFQILYLPGSLFVHMSDIVFPLVTCRSVGVQRPRGSECPQGGGAGGAGGGQRGWVGAGGTPQQILGHSPGWLCADPNHWYFWWSHKVQYLVLQVLDLQCLNLLKCLEWTDCCGIPSPELHGEKEFGVFVLWVLSKEFQSILELPNFYEFWGVSSHGISEDTEREWDFDSKTMNWNIKMWLLAYSDPLCFSEKAVFNSKENVKGKRSLEKCKLLQDVPGMKRMWPITSVQVWYQTKAERRIWIFFGKETSWLVWSDV